MADSFSRPYGAALWGVCRALLESGADLGEVKIVGVRKGKVYVWKQTAGKDPYVAKINPDNISSPQHAPYLIDPPPGTESEAPAIGDIGDPSSFSGNIADIKKVDPEKDVPGVGGAPESGWLPSKKLEMIAKKMKELGLQPQDTFSKAVATGEPIPDAMPEPAGGLQGLADKQGKEVDPEDLKVDEPPPEEPEPEEPEPAEPEPEASEPEGSSLVKDGDWEALADLAKAGKLGAKAKTSLIDQFDVAEEDGDHATKAGIASTLSLAYAQQGAKNEEDFWKKQATNAEDAAADAEAPGLDPDLADAIMNGDWKKVAELGAEGSVEDAETAVQEAQAAMSGAIPKGDFSTAAEAAKAAAALWGKLGHEANAVGMLAVADSYAAKAGDKDAPPAKTTEVTKAPPDTPPAEDEDLGFPWNPKLVGGATPIDEKTSLEKQAEFGLQPNQFVHNVTNEIYALTPFDETKEYVDPKGFPIDKSTGKVSGAKSAVPTGEKFIEASPDVVAPLEPDKPKPKKKVVKKAPPEDTPPPPAASVTPSEIKLGDLPDPAPAAQAEPVVTSDMATAASKVELPEGMPDPSEMKLLGSGNHMGGYGDKNIYEDAKGNKWLHKLAYEKGGHKAKPYAAVAQQVFSQIARMVNPNHLAIGVMTLGGKLGSVQPLVDLDSKQPDYSKTPVTALKQPELESMVKEQLLDWMMSQHDSHRGQFIKGKDGTTYGVDKEQGFRFFGVDKLSVDYAPNPETPVYNEIWKAWADGEVDFDPMILADGLKKIESISTKDYIKTMKPYAETLYSKKPLEQAKFLKAARRRKLDMRKDFEGLVTTLMRKKTKQDGNFNFETGWSGETQSPKGPQVVKKKYTSSDYMKKIASENSAVIKTADFYSDFATKTIDPDKITLKVSKGASGAAQQMLATMGVKPDNAEPFSGPHYDMFFLNKSDFEGKNIELEEIVKPKPKGAIAPTSKKPLYFPNDFDHPKAESNSNDFKNIENTKFGGSAKRIEADGPTVEGSAHRARRWADSKGTYYHVQFKLRPHVWGPLMGKGEGSTYGYPKGSYDAKSDTYKESGSTSDSVSTEKWTADDSEIHLTQAEKSGKHWKTSKYAYMGAVNAKVRPKKGQTVAQATAELLDKMQPGLSKDVMRDATPEEKEVFALSQAMWAFLPQKADGLGPENERDPKKMRAALKKAGISEEDIKSIKQVEVIPGYSTHVLPGRHKKLAEKGMRFPSHGFDPGNVVSMLQKGALGVHERHSGGIKVATTSFDADVKTGSGEGVLGHVMTSSTDSKTIDASKAQFSNSAQMIIDPRELDRLDTYLHYGDMYGSCTPYKPGIGPATAATWNDRTPIEDKVEGLNKDFRHHEINFKRGVRPESILRVHANSESIRKQMIQSLKGAGVQEVNGVPIEDFVVAEKTVGEIHKNYVEPMMSEV